MVLFQQEEACLRTARKRTVSKNHIHKNAYTCAVRVGVRAYLRQLLSPSQAPVSSLASTWLTGSACLNRKCPSANVPWIEDPFCDSVPEERTKGATRRTDHVRMKGLIRVLNVSEHAKQGMHVSTASSSGKGKKCLNTLYCWVASKLCVQRSRQRGTWKSLLHSRTPVTIAVCRHCVVRPSSEPTFWQAGETSLKATAKTRTCLPTTVSLSV